MIADDFLAAHSPAGAVPVAPAVLTARAALEIAGRELGAIPDDALERGWQWRDDEADVRYGLFRGIESIEAVGAAIGDVMAGIGATRTTAAWRIAPTGSARWQLQGLLMSLDDDWLDRHARTGEWTLREVLGHIVGGQRGYAAYTAWWSSLPVDSPLPDRVLDDIKAAAALPDDEDEGAGTLLEIRARFDEVLDQGAAHLAGLSEVQVAHPARWVGIPVDVGFRLGRWSSHIIEHTIQVEKTLDWLKHRPTEAQRIVADLYRAWGRLETVLVPLDAAWLAAPDHRGRTANDLLAELGRELVADARSARAAALD